jgi:Zn2+/Cd2+-exporting ATPase
MTDATISHTGLAAPDSALLTTSEQHWLGVRLTVALISGGCLILAAIIQIAVPSQHDVAELVAGVAALLVAVPAISAAWHSLCRPDLHGITDQLIALALIAAWAAGDLITAALLPMIMTIGHVLEERSLLGSQEAIRALSRLTRIKARRITSSGEIEEVEAKALQVDDMIELRGGDLIPADGVVLTGTSSVDTASITGESVPIEVEPGAGVFSGFNQSRRRFGGENRECRRRNDPRASDRLDAGGRASKAAGDEVIRTLRAALYGAGVAAGSSYLVHDQ